VQLSVRTVTVELAETFVIARSAEDAVTLVEVEVVHGSFVGYG
jgi:hypothetical protein